MTLTPQLSAALAGPEWLRARRAAAASTIESTPIPSTEQELWRYSRVSDINLDHYSLAVEGAGKLSADAEELVGLIEHPAVVIVVVDGFVTSLLCADGDAAKGVNVATPESEHWSGAGLGDVAKPVDIFGVLNASFSTSPIHIDIPRGVVVEHPIVVINHVSSDGIATFPRTVVHAGEASQATVYELHTSSASDALVVPVVEHDIEQAANLSYINVQVLDNTIHHVGYNASRVARDAHFSSTTIALGGDYARVRTDSFVDGKGANSNLRAVYFGAGHQMHDFRTLQQHDAPKTTSDLFFKGAVGDASRSVYSGLIRVSKGASGTNAYQTNRNLVLTQGAHAESVPNLEIEENDVKCSHASAIGPKDEDHRYYLESRGVPTEVANRLIAKGFLDEVLDGLPSQGLRNALGDQIGAKLDRIIT